MSELIFDTYHGPVIKKDGKCYYFDCDTADAVNTTNDGVVSFPDCQTCDFALSSQSSQSSISSLSSNSSISSSQSSENPNLVPIVTLNFNGISDFISYGNSPEVQINGSRTLSMWVYPRNSIDFQVFASKQTELVSSQLSWVLYSDSDNKLKVKLSQDGFSSGILSSSNTLNYNQWNFISFRLDNAGSQVKLYLNGVETTFAWASSTFNSPNDLVIGATDNGVTGHFDGAIALFRLFDSFLDTTELDELYNNGNPKLYINSSLDLRDLMYIAAEYMYDAPWSKYEEFIELFDLYNEYRIQDGNLTDLSPNNYITNGTSNILTNELNNKSVFSFNGTSQYLYSDDVSYSLSGIDQPFGIQFTAKTYDTSGVILSFNNLLNDSSQQSIVFNDSNQIQIIRTDDSTTTQTITYSTPLSSTYNTWFLEFNGTQGTIYRDGIELLTGSLNVDEITLNSFTVGASRDVSGVLNYLEADIASVIVIKENLVDEAKNNFFNYDIARYFPEKDFTLNRIHPELISGAIYTGPSIYVDVSNNPEVEYFAYVPEIITPLLISGGILSGGPLDTEIITPLTVSGGILSGGPLDSEITTPLPILPSSSSISSSSSSL